MRPARHQLRGACRTVGTSGSWKILWQSETHLYLVRRDIVPPHAHASSWHVEDRIEPKFLKERSRGFAGQANCRFSAVKGF